MPAGLAIQAGIAYFALVFLTGFVLGAVRIAVLVPTVGELAAVLIEIPVILAISWVVCAALVRRFGVPAESAPRFVMGAVAFVCLIAAEIVLSAVAFGRGPGAFLADLGRPAGAAGLAAQVLFAIFPRLQMRRL